MISDNTKYWIWLTQSIGYNNPKIKKLVELYSDISEFYFGGEKEWKFCGIFNSNDILKMKSESLDSSIEIINQCSILNYSIITIDNPEYPSCLLNIYSPPAVLYVKGKFPDIDNRLSIGIVGTRRATQYGIDNSYKFAYALAKYGVTIVSGGALGVDCASHRGVLAANGVTICVRGCGINCDYLKDNQNMRDAICKNGAVISEYPPNEKPRNYYFPARNRIISALSDGLLVIEAGKKSGSLITANLAIEQGKEVFALLGNNSPQNEGSNNRIKEGSAIPVTDFMDILSNFDNLCVTCNDVDYSVISVEDLKAIPVKGMSKSKANNSLNKPLKITDLVDEEINKNEKTIKHKQNLNLSNTAQTVYNFITNEPVHIDNISSNLGIPVFKVLSAITQLEMKGLVQAIQGRRYKLK